MIVNERFQKKDEVLTWLASEHDSMLALVENWAKIPSGSDDQEGLKKMQKTLHEAFKSLKPDHSESFPMGGLHFSKRLQAPLKILFVGHFDTVFSKNHSFFPVTQIDSNRLQGPGVADMKGGLVVLLKALEAFEQFSLASHIGWEIILNPDEEIGSVHSQPYLEKSAKRCQIGLLFEPSLPDGSLVSARSSSANYLIESIGKAAHAGRDFHLGKNAISALAHWMIKAEDKMKNYPKALFNIGIIQGGGAANIVPDHAYCLVNLRCQKDEDHKVCEQELQQLALSHDLLFIRKTFRPSKPFTAEIDHLLHAFLICAQELGFALTWRETGGVCDGNTVASVGLPALDTLGVRGGNIHTTNEYLITSSLVERAQLTALFLVKLAMKELEPPQKI